MVDSRFTYESMLEESSAIFHPACVSRDSFHVAPTDQATDELTDGQTRYALTGFPNSQMGGEVSGLTSGNRSIKANTYT